VDASSGYEGVAARFVAARERMRPAVGEARVRAWAGALPRGAPVLDAG
jgi:hypothetical protein